MLHRDWEVSPTQREQESPAPKADKYRNGVMKYPQTANYILFVSSPLLACLLISRQSRITRRLMKIITFVCLTLVVLSIGCFDGDRGVLTELLPDAAPPVPVRVPLTAEIAVGTGSELVVSPVPTEIEDALWGSWDKDLDSLEHILSLPGISPTDEIEGGVSSSFTPFCEVVHRRLFYDKYIDAGGIAILAPSDRTSSAGVDDEYLFATREIILTMTSKRPELREVMSPARGFRYVLVTINWASELHMPLELRYLGMTAGGFYRSGLAVGGLSWDVFHRVPLLRSGTMVHEMAHAIDDAFDRYPHLFPDWGTRLTAAFEVATAKAQQGNGFFPSNSYALTNEKEYWAEGAKAWFEDIHGDNLHDELQRARLIEQDPLLYALLNEVFPAVDLPVHIEIAE